MLNRMHRILLVLVLISQTGRAEDFKPLFNGKDLTGWVPVNVAPSTFTVRDGMIICSGKPTGVMRSDRMYENFIFECEWRHMVPKGNAGIFVWADALTAPGVPFSRSVEIQVLDGPNGDWYTTHGDVFPIHGARMKPANPGKANGRAYPTEHRSNPSPQWNHYRIECRNGNISLAVNGKVVTRGSAAVPRKGYLCLESEGGVVHWRNLRIRELPPSTEPLPSEHIAEPAAGFVSLYTGVDLSGWKTSDEVKQNWRVADWRLHSRGSADRPILWTESEFSEFTMILDVRAPGGERAGAVLLRGSESARIELPGGKNWQRFIITVADGAITVTTDGETIVKNRPLGEVPETGPIGLEPASNPSDFASIYIRPE